MPGSFCSHRKAGVILRVRFIAHRGVTPTEIHGSSFPFWASFGVPRPAGAATTLRQKTPFVFEARLSMKVATIWRRSWCKLTALPCLRGNPGGLRRHEVGAENSRTRKG